MKSKAGDWTTCRCEHRVWTGMYWVCTFCGFLFRVSEGLRQKIAPRNS
jgi:hypothetical protein